ncbi:hypothetical protein DFJ74DRAFT_673906 [Hyaloraphidium curvatum]|nr:hypothetical protein DFJ74DRAFT_673906 [Hyaloraphidium curvatum]
MSQELYQPWMCNSACVEIQDVARGTVARYTVADRCVGCGWGGIDMTPAAMRAIGRDVSDGMFEIRWRFC